MCIRLLQGNIGLKAVVFFNMNCLIKQICNLSLLGEHLLTNTPVRVKFVKSHLYAAFSSFCGGLQALAKDLITLYTKKGFISDNFFQFGRLWYLVVKH